MITLQWPFVLALLPLPFLVRLLLPRAPERQAGALRLPFFADLARAGLVAAGRPRFSRLRLATLAFIWTLLVIAAARPVYVGTPVAIPVEGREMMLAVDLSASMSSPDLVQSGVPANRLQVVKRVADDFIARRTGDRIGLILFSTRAYVQAPLTLDRNVVRQLLAEASIGMTGRNTSIGDAIGLAVKTLRDRPAKDRVLILLTDGANTSGVLDPMEAAAIAAKENVRIHTIGVGADSNFTDIQPGMLMNPSGDLDEEALKKIAGLTGGQYFRARNDKGLAAIYADIDRLEPVAGDPQYVRPTIALFYWPLGAALLLSFVLSALLLLHLPLRRRAGGGEPARLEGSA
ncbi:vWA domain-containing protein [Xanthobacter versatilis]|uniref:von Willebrand factor type A n=1 Tax=Xanthobacter autotrophicus (strain ATCC BAA-1158 / Py2) TaxID=78245 RepID=A7IDL0_XANP2|nr:von Willebrand factor type A [Xanthobacter autotrophicus Py2]